MRWDFDPSGDLTYYTSAEAEFYVDSENRSRAL